MTALYQLQGHRGEIPLKMRHICVLLVYLGLSIGHTSLVCAMLDVLGRAPRPSSVTYHHCQWLWLYYGRPESSRPG